MEEAGFLDCTVEDVDHRVVASTAVSCTRAHRCVVTTAVQNLTAQGVGGRDTEAVLDGIGRGGALHEPGPSLGSGGVRGRCVSV